jgi:predicted CopG family antitoxin
MVKVISLSEEAYRLLKSIKGNKSFSEIVVEIVPEKRDIMELAGAFKENKDYWEKFDKKVYSYRKKAKLRDFKW